MDFSQYPNFTSFLNRPILAIDYGKKTTGLAKFCPGIDPFPLIIGGISYKSDLDLIQEIKKVLDEEMIEVIVLGLPLMPDGKESRFSSRVKQFGNELENAVKNIPILYQDESYSSQEAKERMKNSPRYNFQIQEEHIDELSASIILEFFIKGSPTEKP